MATLIESLSKDYILETMTEKGASKEEIEKVTIYYNAVNNTKMLEKVLGVGYILDKYILGISSYYV